jgi:putative transposase
MPNHFHLMIYADDRTIQQSVSGNIKTNVLSKGIKTLLSSYTRGINNELNQTGSLFTQNTKSKNLTKFDLNENKVNSGAKNVTVNYPYWCINYIHQNPLKAGLVNKIEDWEFSSFRDYIGIRNGSLCNKELAVTLLDIEMRNFYTDSYNLITESILEKLF